MFLALDLPEDARRRIAVWRDQLLAGLDDLRLVAPEALHLTLVFLGPRPEKEIPSIARTAFEAVAGLPAAGLRPAAATAVPPRRPRLLALDLDDEGGRAAAIQAAASGALARGGFHEPEQRPFWPHITLARAKGGRRAPSVPADPPPDQPFAASEVALYRSLLHPEGARYERLERLRLSPQR